MCSDKLICYLFNTAHSCSQRSPATVWLASERPITLYLFQKYVLCWEYKYLVYSNEIASVEVKFYVFYYSFILLKIDERKKL